MGVIKGQNLRLKIGTGTSQKYIAFATTCTVHVSATLEDSSTKDSTGDWQNQEITGLAWDISTDALFSVDTDATGQNAQDALDLVLAKQKVFIEFEIGTSGAKNRVDGSTAYSGWAWVNDISISAPNRQNATYSLQAQGDGALSSGRSSSSNL